MLEEDKEDKKTRTETTTLDAPGLGIMCVCFGVAAIMFAYGGCNLLIKKGEALNRSSHAMQEAADK